MRSRAGHGSHSSIFRSWLLGGVMALALLGAPAAGQSGGGFAWSQDPATRCQFVAPASLTPGPTTWSGACPGGKASGLGMLRRRDGARAGFAFYGELREGVPRIGVVDFGGGYQAGMFENGDIGLAAEIAPQIRIDAFLAAARAARAVSARYSAEGNVASARHYEAVAKTLEQQIE